MHVCSDRAIDAVIAHTTTSLPESDTAGIGEAEIQT